MIYKEILFEPFDKQIKFLEAIFSGKYNFILYGGSIRGGKTFAGLGALILLCKIYPTSRWVLVRKSLQTIKQNTLPSWEKIKPINFVKSFNHDTMTVSFINDSQLIFFGENYDIDKELNRWRGLECNGFLLEEMNELQEQSYYKAIERAGSYIVKSGKQPKPIILGTCNPTYGWVKEKIYDKWEKNELPENQLYIQSRIFDNPYIPEEYRESLKSLPRYEYEVFVEGNWNIQLKQGGEFLKNFELDKHVKPVNIDLDGTLHISVDNNVLPYVAVSVWQLERDNEKWKAKKVHEIPAKDPDNTASKAGRKTVAWLKEIDFNNKIFMYGDPTNLNRNTINDDKKNFYDLFVEPFQQAGFGFEKRYFNKAPSVPATGDFINAILEGKIQNIDIVYNEQCKESISDNIETKQDRDGSILKKRETDPKTGSSYEKHGHFVDTDRYFLCKVFYDEFQKFRNRFANYSDKTVPSYENELLKGF